jgi:hypothetical protein
MERLLDGKNRDETTIIKQMQGEVSFRFPVPEICWLSCILCYSDKGIVVLIAIVIIIIIIIPQ